MAETQATCLEDGACPEPLDMPDDLDDFLEDVEGTDQTDDVTPEADDSDRLKRVKDTPEADDELEADGTPDARDNRNPTPEADETPAAGND